jgi:tetratricopeptide (TPR) repeat protein
MPPRRVFISYRTLDREHADTLATWLRASGVDAFLDLYEIAGGDDIVQVLERGLDTAEAGILLLSPHGVGETWTRWELSILLTRAITERGFRLLPVLTTPDAPVPRGLTALRRLRIEDRGEILTSLLGTSRRPPLGAVPDGLGLPPVYTLRVDPGATPATLDVRLRGPDNAALAATTTTLLPAHLLQLGVKAGADTRPWDELTLSAPTGPTRDSSVGARTAHLAALGRVLGELLLPNEITACLPQDRFTLRFEPGDDTVLALPVEAAWLRPDLPLCLVPGVHVVRVVPGADRPLAARAGPLRVLVVIADAEGSGAHVLDTANERGVIVRALEHARGTGLEVQFIDGDGDTLTELRGRVLDWQPHVVHVSAHGGPKSLLLEGADGRAKPASIDDFAGSLLPNGEPPPLVVLSACSTARPDPLDRTHFATGLLAAGVPQVIAMQTPVGDAYASALAGELYRALAKSPVAVDALARVRQEVEHQRRDALRHGQACRFAAPEYATATCFGRAHDWGAALIDPALPPRPTTRGDPPAVPGLVRLHPGEFVGRRALRRALRGAVVSGRGALLWGMGGIGKSSLAYDLLQRLVADGWAVAVPQSLLPGDIHRAIVTAAADRVSHTDPTKGASYEALLVAGVPERQVARGAARALAQERVVLLLDDLHEAVDDTHRFKDGDLPILLRALIDSASVGAVLATSRHRLPELTSLRALPVPPLHPEEVGMLLWRLPTLRERADAASIAAGLGGHPRVLEFADALLARDGRVRFDHVLARLERLAESEGTSLPDPEAEDFERLAFARALLAADILLEALLTNLSPEARAVLPAVAVYDRPVPIEALRAVAGTVGVTDTHRLRRLLEPLVASTLVSAQGDTWVVHRWTADEIWKLGGGRPQAADRAAADWWLRKRPKLPEEDVLAGITHLLEAGEVERAARHGIGLADARMQWGRASDALALLLQVAGKARGEVLGRLRGSMVDPLVALGRVQEALTVGGEAEILFQDALRAAPDRADLQRDLSISYNNLGDLHARAGNGKLALDYFEKALAIAQALAQREPDRADLQRDLSVSYNQLGDLHAALGNGKLALDHFEKDLAIAQALAQREPDQVDLQRDLFVSYNKLGDLHARAGNGKLALDYFEKALAQREPDRADLQRGLANSYERMAQMKPGEAARWLGESVAIRRVVLARDPAQAILVRELAIALLQLGQATQNVAAFGEGAVALLTLRRQGRLEAQYWALADELAPMVEAAGG